LKRLLQPVVVAFASWLHGLGIFLLVSARRLVRLIERHTIDTTSDRFVMELPQLHRKIRQELQAQRREYDSYAYFHGYPYQALAILDVFGERGTEERFDAYELADLVHREDHLLDIGCNCGFMALYTAFRTGCSADGIDINPYMIRIGQHCAEFLRLQDKVKLVAQPFQDYKPGQTYTVVLSFATHWTDDCNYRVRLQDHLLRIHGMMTDGGLLVFESHSADVGNAEFYAALEEMRAYFSWEGHRLMARGTRELYLMRRIAT
jgi:SAM-dependent methyltransferase